MPIKTSADGRAVFAARGARALHAKTRAEGRVPGDIGRAVAAANRAARARAAAAGVYQTAQPIVHLLDLAREDGDSDT